LPTRVGAAALLDDAFNPYSVAQIGHITLARFITGASRIGAQAYMVTDRDGW